MGQKSEGDLEMPVFITHSTPGLPSALQKLMQDERQNLASTTQHHIVNRVVQSHCSVQESPEFSQKGSVYINRVDTGGKNTASTNSTAVP